MKGTHRKKCLEKCLISAVFRNKAGMWGWRSDKTENVNGYECKVFSATNVELVTKTRMEHLTEIDKANARNKNNKTALQNFLGIAEVEGDQAVALPLNVSFYPFNQKVFCIISCEAPSTNNFIIT